MTRERLTRCSNRRIITLKSKPMTSSESRRRTGFTLIELLVVIAITAILAAMLVEVAKAYYATECGAVRRKTDKVACV